MGFVDILFFFLFNFVWLVELIIGLFCFIFDYLNILCFR